MDVFVAVVSCMWLWRSVYSLVRAQCESMAYFPLPLASSSSSPRRPAALLPSCPNYASQLGEAEEQLSRRSLGEADKGASAVGLAQEEENSQRVGNIVNTLEMGQVSLSSKAQPVA
jgi:hypothetical protein